MQKPFSISALLDTVENREAYEGLKSLMTTSRDIVKDLNNNPSSCKKELFEGLRKAQKFRRF